MQVWIDLGLVSDGVAEDEGRVAVEQVGDVDQQVEVGVPVPRRLA